jgi:L-lactate dehydrogenase complex protein LldG
MSARQETLKRIEDNTVSKNLPPVWKPENDIKDLPEKFADALISVDGEVYLVGSLNKGVEKVRELLSQLETSKVVISQDIAATLDSILEPSWYILGKSKGDLRKFCASADVGLTGVEAALAETGSVVVKSGPESSRVVSLLPPVHIALVPISKIFPSIFEWKDALTGELPAQMVIISGPSKTADIEQTLSVGVHGPKRFMVILYED